MKKKLTFFATILLALTASATETDFSEPYVCAANKAQLVGEIAYKQPDTIYYYSEAKGTATWRFNATKACYVQVALNITKSSNDHKLKVYLIDNTTGVKIDSVAETAQNATVDDIDLGVMLIPTTGDYSVQLSNMLSWSAVHLSGITLTKECDLIDIYLKAGEWNADKPKFGVYVCDEGWWPEFMENVEGDLYVFRNFPANKILLNFVRFNNTADAPSDTYKWNEVVDMTRTNDNNYFMITGWGSGTYSTGEWRKYFPGFEAGYYLVGTHNSWEPTAADIMDENGSGEYKKIKDVAEGDQFKAIRIDTERLNAGWYPDGIGNEYTIPAELAGNVTIYFRPDGNNEWPATHGGDQRFYVVKNGAPTAIDNTLVGEKAVKLMENGQIVIIKNGVRYNVLGTVIE